MLTASGRVMLVDFGLASTSGGEAVTRTGLALGSLPYMAPEQLMGRATDIGPRTDVYGLGVTLFECIALRRPFQHDDATRLRAAILAASPPRLSSLAGGRPARARGRGRSGDVARARAPLSQRRRPARAT
jgi:serine/threonine-protein kinase